MSASATLYSTSTLPTARELHGPSLQKYSSGNVADITFGKHPAFHLSGSLLFRLTNGGCIWHLGDARMVTSDYCLDKDTVLARYASFLGRSHRVLRHRVNDGYSKSSGFTLYSMLIFINHSEKLSRLSSNHDQQDRSTEPMIEQWISPVWMLKGSDPEPAIRKCAGDDHDDTKHLAFAVQITKLKGPTTSLLVHQVYARLSKVVTGRVD